MHQIKIFKGIESDIAHLEDQVNSWLAASQVKVVNMFGNISPQTTSESSASVLSKGTFAPSDVLLVVLYEKK